MASGLIRRAGGAWRETLRWVIAIGIGLLGFSFFVAIVGADPWQALTALWQSTVVDEIGPGEVLVAAAPVILCALAVAIPARAGLWNLGGEGQLVMGVVGATAASMMLPADLPGIAALPMIGLGGAVVGGAWAVLAAGLRVTVGLNEAICSLLLSYIAVRVLDYFVHGPWKDAASLGFPQAAPLPDSHRLPEIISGRMHVGIIVAVVAVVVVFVAMRRTTWGFHLRVVGGNAEAGRRAGLPVKTLILTSMAVGGGLAGLAGAVQLAGVEFQARPEIAGAYGFLGFLVSWLAKHDPRWILIAGVVIGGVAVGGDALQIDADLPGASVNILMALLLLAVLGRSASARGAEG
jgi:general nucleoside transport system permease protein